MIKRLLIFTFAVALGGVANAQVVWTYSGGSTTDATAWEDAANWTAPSGNAYTTPSGQFVASTIEGLRSFINDDVTKIAITGYTVNKLLLGEEEQYKNTDDIYMGGTDCWLALDNATLTVQDDIKTAREDTGAGSPNSKITLANGSTLNGDEYYTAFASSSDCTLDILSGSTMNVRRVRAGYGGKETITIDGVGSTLNVEESMRIGYSGYSSGNTNVMKVYLSNGGKIVTGNETGVRVAEADYSRATMTVTGTAANPCIIDTSVDGEGKALGGLRVASGVDTVGSLTVTYCTITSSNVSVGSGAGSDGTMTLNNGTTLSVGISTARNSEDLYIGDNDGTGLMTVNSGASVYVADDIYLADNSLSHGTLTVNAGGSIDCDSSLKLADDGTGVVNVYGTVDFSSDASVSIKDGSNGTLNIYDGAVMNVGGQMKTNDATDAACSGEIVMTGGDLNIDDALIIAFKGGVGSTGIFTLSGGTVDIACNNEIDDYNGLILGNRVTDADATVNIDGGTMTVAGAIYMGSLIDPENTSGTDTGVLRLNINGGTLQAEDYIDEGTFSDHLITLTDGFLRIASANMSEAEMLALIGTDIICPNGYTISTDGSYTVLAGISLLIPGDTNDDSIVDSADAANVAANWGSTVTEGDYASGDFNGDGVVNAADASIMAANWGDHTGTEQSTGTVPEPSVLMLLFGALPFVYLRRRG